MVSWLSINQTSVVLSTSEDEYIVACSTYSEAVWLCKLLTVLFNTEMDATDIYWDNQSCSKLTENPVLHDKSKHIHIKYHYIWYTVQRGAIKLQYVPTEEQVADVLTKPLSHVKFEYFRDKLGIV